MIDFTNNGIVASLLKKEYDRMDDKENKVVDMVIDSVKESKEEGIKHDTGKPMWAILPFDAIGSIAKVLTFGAEKYGPRNWEKGMDWDRPFSALMRHLTSWWEGEDKDKETGFSHLWHAGSCLLFLIAYELRGTGRDTRFKKTINKGNANDSNN